MSTLFRIKCLILYLIYLTGWGVLVAKHMVCVEMGLISSFNCFSASGVKDGYSIHRSNNHNEPYSLPRSLSLSLPFLPAKSLIIWERMLVPFLQQDAWMPCPIPYQPLPSQHPRSIRTFVWCLQMVLCCQSHSLDI